MEYLIGLILALAVAGSATAIGLDRERAFYPTVLMVIASYYYVLFAVMGASPRTLLIEIAVASGCLLFAVLGFKRSLWFAVAAIVGHGVFDSVHHWFIANPGVPYGWPGFCLTFDVILGAWLAVRLLRARNLHPNPNGDRTVESHPFRKVREKDGAPLVRYSSRSVTFGAANGTGNSVTGGAHDILNAEAASPPIRAISRSSRKYHDFSQ